MNELFCDGGCVFSNPSPIAGTWAWVHTIDGSPTTHDSGIIYPNNVRSLFVSNNVSEYIALLKGLNSLDSEWRGTIYSDSQITFGRFHLGWKNKNIPQYLIKVLDRTRDRLVYWKNIKWVLLEGHPTKIDLYRGYGKSGRPVSIWNQWCDEECNRRAQELLLEVN